ncbi:MAG: hypothetical protein KKA54_08195 [Proteobacteria bacterium]|nr:hypothetical protein [Pseudomonadota bacterium]MBU0966346.1 hypothetical protein [Pseudomonadota bacterium]
MKITTNLLSWGSYEYIGPDDKFHQVHFDEQGGPDGKPCIWADDTMWSIDTPESPHSILGLIYYPFWVLEPPYDLRNAMVEFHLRGDGLDLKGGKCFFWVHTSTLGSTRWHYNRYPLAISDGTWDKPLRLYLDTDPKSWHCSFISDPLHARSLPMTLKACSSFGFSFIGFSEKVTGKLSLSEFTIQADIKTNWPYNADFSKSANRWLTVSRRQGRQISMQSETIQDRIEMIENQTIHLAYNTDDFLPITDSAPSFAYLGFVHASQSTLGENLCNSFLYVRQYVKNLDLKNGTIHFFVEHARSGTRWVFRVENIRESGTINMILRPEEQYWYRLSGTAPLESVLAGTSGDNGYDYFGFLTMAPQAPPTGTWGLYQFSIGPRLIEEG